MVLSNLQKKDQIIGANYGVITSFDNFNVSFKPKTLLLL